MKNETGKIKNRQENEKLRKAIFDMVSVGIIDKPINQLYDIVSTTALILNLIVTIMATFSRFDVYKDVFKVVESCTVAIFAIDYILRLITAKYLYPAEKEVVAIRKYALSFFGLVDLLSFLPYYLPFFFPAGAVAFRMIRVVRILRLFRINAYYDSLNVITDVIRSRKQQLISSVFIIAVLMVASSLCMYSLEHEAQPDVFENAFSGIWWSASTLLTVGYGDIYPVTIAGKCLGILITFLGVGMVAIPTGIISAGFVEQYDRAKIGRDIATEEDVHFISVVLNEEDFWTGKEIKDIGLPRDSIIAFIMRNQSMIIPNGDTTLLSGDNVIIGADSADTSQIDLKEISLGKNHRWIGSKIKDLDISRQSYIVMIKRENKSMVPYGKLKLMENDKLVIYTKIKNNQSDGMRV